VAQVLAQVRVLVLVRALVLVAAVVRTGCRDRRRRRSQRPILMGRTLMGTTLMAGNRISRLTTAEH
jgi:hypothetical protein